jgi:starch synthase
MRSAGRPNPPTVAILPWGDVFEDWLDRLGVPLDRFAGEFIGSWMFGYAEALHRAGLSSVLVCITDRVDGPLHTTHAPTGTPLVFLPTTRLSRTVRGPRLRRHVAPYLSNPPIELARTLRRLGCSAIICQEYETPRYDLAVVLARLLRLRVFATFQGGDYQVSRLERFVRPWTIGRADRLIIASGSETERLRSRYHIPDRRIARVFNPVDVDLWRPRNSSSARRELQLPADAQVVAWHGQVQIQRKGLDTLLAAWSQICAQRPGRDLRLLLAGAGEDAQALRNAIASQALDGIDFQEGWLGRAELARRLAAADVYAFPSRHEGFAIAPVEAMACGTPVVAADVAGIRDLLAEGGGILAPAGDACAFADAVGSLLDNESRRLTLAERARDRAVEACSLDTVGHRLRAVLFEESSA